MIKLKSLVLIPLILFSSFSLLAAPDPDKEARFESYRDTLSMSRYINVPDHVLEHLYQTEVDQDRKLTGTELVMAAVGYANERGEELERRLCFACHMKVLTPEGYRRIDDLQIGDTVMSWDARRQRLVRNRILEIHESENVAYGELTDHKSEHGSFEVTPEHPFFRPDRKKAREISRLHLEAKLLRIDAITVKGCETALVNRGPYEMRGTTKVMTLTLEKSPNNYIVNGIVVMNKPIHITMLMSFMTSRSA